MGIRRTRIRRYLSLAGALLLPALGPLRVDAAVDPEQGLPIISTFLPSKYNTPAAPVGPQAFALTPLRDGSIAVANNAGLLRLNGTSATAWNPTGGNVLSLSSAADGSVYTGGVGQIGYFSEFGHDFHSLTPAVRALGAELGDVWITVAARSGDVYFADTSHVFRWDGQILHKAYTGQPELLVGAAFGNGAVVLDPGAGLVAIDASDARTLDGSLRLTHGGPCALAAAADGVITVCGDGSVMRWGESGGAQLLPCDADVGELLRNAGITTAGLREDGMLLIGTRRAGVLMLDRDGHLGGRLSAVPDWGDSRVFSQLLRHGDGFWIGLDYGVSHVEWPGQLTRFDASLGLPRAALATLRIDGTLLAATTRGVYRVTTLAADSAFARFEPYAPTRTTLFGVAQAGDTLFMASGDGVAAVHGGNAQTIDAQLSYAVLPLDAQGTQLVAGGLDGARVLRKSGASWTSTALPKIDTEIRHLLLDRDGAVWLSGNYNGVFRFDPAADPLRVDAFGSAEGVPPGRIVPLNLPDGVAFDSAQGIVRFDVATQRFVADAALRALLPKAQGTVRLAVPLDATRALLVQHDRVRLIERAAGGWRELFTPLARLPRGLDYRDVRVDADGSVWIAGNEALFEHKPALQSTLPDLPQPHASLMRGGELVAASDDALELGTAPQTVHAHFEEAFFDGVEQLRFRTRLEPLEQAWSDWQALPEREMTQVRDGDYRLLVQVRDIFGRESEPAAIAFTLAPPWFLRWWAFTLYAVAMAGVLALMIRRRERRLRRRAEELAALVSARTQQLEQASVTDALTGLRNRHYVQLLEPSWRERKRGWWLIALVDIDHFKRINDERGHAAGDEVLRALARRLSGVLSAAETAVRWGGEEFLIVGELEDAAIAPTLMRRLLEAVGNDPVAIAGATTVAVTCSIGWDVVAVRDAASLDAMLASADHKLYAAKHAGRDRAAGPDGMVITRGDYRVVAY